MHNHRLLHLLEASSYTTKTLNPINNNFQSFLLPVRCYHHSMLWFINLSNFQHFLQMGPCSISHWRIKDNHFKWLLWHLLPIHCNCHISLIIHPGTAPKPQEPNFHIQKTTSFSLIFFFYQTNSFHAKLDPSGMVISHWNWNHNVRTFPVFHGAGIMWTSRSVTSYIGALA